MRKFKIYKLGFREKKGDEKVRFIFVTANSKKEAIATIEESEGIKDVVSVEEGEK